MLRTLLIVALVAGSAARAAADPVATYAIVVGSNTGGAGQTDLRYAEDDARRVGALLVELGGYTADQVDVVVHPTPDELRDRLGKLGERITADLGAGRQSRIFFYYSGHARASAIDLGDSEMPLAELRQRLFQIPATLTVVVLDACQSGAFSRIKGAEPAADFSFNSRQHLDASGVAVLASSSGSELSQESEQLRSSYFTHHLLVGLRGAGDANGDGEVSIDEAYRYAYHQTLLATAETAVGGQHVTFEADLKGHGEVALSFPRAATSAIELPAAMEGQALVEDKHAHTVVAETYKAKGAPVRIAVAPGEYEVVVRHGRELSHCEVSSGGVVDLDHCRTEALVTTASKGGGFGHRDRLELAYVIGPERDDAYTQNLKAFGYRDGLGTTQGVQGLDLVRVERRVWVGVGVGMMWLPTWTQQIVGSNQFQTLDWQLYTATAVARGQEPIASWHGLGGPAHLSGYAQLGGGLGLGRTEHYDAMNTEHADTHFGPAFSAGAGLNLADGLLPGFGLSVGVAYDYAPVISDLIGNTHASGGLRGVVALTFNP